MASSAADAGPFVGFRSKVCGITRPADARIAEGSGASCLGVILVPDTPRFISLERAAEIAGAVRIPVVAVLTERRPEAIARIAGRVGAKIVQLHGEADPSTFRAVRELGEWELWGAARVRSGDEALGRAGELADVADLLLLDGWHPQRIGGTGRRFPWAEVERMRDAWPRQIGMGVAGGLTPENVEEAIVRLRPHLVDVSSGVEAKPGVKDPELVASFLDKARSAWSRNAAEDGPDHSPPPSHSG